MTIPEIHMKLVMTTAMANMTQLLKTPRSIIIRQGTPNMAKHDTKTRQRSSIILEKVNSPTYR